MDSTVLLVALFVLVGIVVAVILARRSRRRDVREAQEDAADAVDQARQWIDRLAGQLSAPRTGAGSSGAFHAASLADHSPPDGGSTAARFSWEAAAERLAVAEAALGAETPTPAHALRSRKAAVEGLHYVRAARIADGAEPGAPLPRPAGSDTAGAVRAQHAAEFRGVQLRAAPGPSEQTPHYFPGGRVRGRPVPRGWYSQRWWTEALEASGWPEQSAELFDALLTGDPGIGYDGTDFESGYGEHPAEAD